MEKKKFLVATDLTEASDRALKTACLLASEFNNEVILLHIFEVADVDENAKRIIASSFFNRDIKHQLRETVEQIASTEKVQISYLTKEGELFNEIKKATSETGADILFIGTHGVHGIQHLTGSFIAKTVNTVSIPVWITQKDTPVERYENLIIYIDEFPEEVLNPFTLELAKKYSCDLHFVITEPANAFHVTEIIKKTSEKLDAEELNYTFTNISEHTDKLKSLEEFASGKKSPLIITNRNNKPVDTMVQILTNRHHIEVLCLNSN
ncbi:MAG: universal stress protein [Flavobacteriales bacterium]|nr:universal stress protein [Flavobacteriales bacterium]